MYACAQSQGVNYFSLDKTAYTCGDPKRLQVKGGIAVILGRSHQNPHLSTFKFNLWNK